MPGAIGDDPALKVGAPDEPVQPAQHVGFPIRIRMQKRVDDIGQRHPFVEQRVGVGADDRHVELGVQRHEVGAGVVHPDTHPREPQIGGARDVGGLRLNIDGEAHVQEKDVVRQRLAQRLGKAIASFGGFQIAPRLDRVVGALGQRLVHEARCETEDVDPDRGAEIRRERRRQAGRKAQVHETGHIDARQVECRRRVPGADRGIHDEVREIHHQRAVLGQPQRRVAHAVDGREFHVHEFDQAGKVEGPRELVGIEAKGQCDLRAGLHGKGQPVARHRHHNRQAGIGNGGVDRICHVVEVRVVGPGVIPAVRGLLDHDVDRLAADLGGKDQLLDTHHSLGKVRAGRKGARLFRHQPDPVVGLPRLEGIGRFIKIALGKSERVKAKGRVGRAPGLARAEDGQRIGGARPAGRRNRDRQPHSDHGIAIGRQRGIKQRGERARLVLVAGAGV